MLLWFVLMDFVTWVLCWLVCYCGLGVYLAALFGLVILGWFSNDLDTLIVMLFIVLL